MRKSLSRPGQARVLLGLRSRAPSSAENIKMTRATVAGIQPSPTAGRYGRVKFDPRLFDLDTLARHGK